MFVWGVAARHRNITVIDGVDAGYGNDLFNDAVHLNRRGAAAYTEAVGAAVAAALANPAGPRRAVLPGFRPAPDAGFEDLAQSYHATLKGDGTRRR